MSTIARLLLLLEAVGDDYLRPGHPSTRGPVSPEDREHDRTRPADPTADTVADPARLALAGSRKRAMDLVTHLARFPISLRATAIAAQEARLAAALADLEYAWEFWAGDLQESSPVK